MDEDFSGDKGCAVADIMKVSMSLHQIVQTAEKLKQIFLFRL